MFFASSTPGRRLYRRARPIILATLILYGIYWFVIRQPVDGHGWAPKGSKTGQQVTPQPSIPLPPLEIQKDLVVASMTTDNTSWLYEFFPDWHKSIYVVDDKNAQLTVEKNKGRESMVYLTYIIDNYDHLPEYMLFIHSQRYQWHNDDPYYDGRPMIESFQIPYLEEQGYVNLRCAWVLGCPEEIHPFTDIHREDVHAGEYFKTGFMHLFPGVKVPEAVGVSCCAQFGVTKWKVHERPKSEYERYRKWLLETPLEDDLSGRIMEYSWHMIFGMEPIHCPAASECYCKVFGLCDLTCNDVESCEGRYVLPPFSTLPEGWPYVGWKGQPQDPSKGGLPET
ncbi:hypothetical protein VTN77DRAFT_7037 [Rasamsonia byssochlamydoides]|uniref:uncharacterized protein n=1 Tax=Rasamsonia byssochlamydoides TaxID=89139 RepID=UPI0037447E13